MTMMGLRFVPTVGEHSATFSVGTPGQGETILSRVWEKSGGEIPSPGTATLTLSVPENRTTMTAPGGFFIEAKLDDADVENWRKDPVFKWTFGIPGKVFTRLDEDYFWRDQNVAWGFQTMVAYHPSPEEFAGAANKTFTVTCECVFQNRTTGDLEGYTETIALTVNNPNHANHVLAGTNTICVSPGGATGQEPAGADIVASWAAAESAAAGKNNYRILFHGGETYTFGPSEGISPPESHNPTGICHVGTYPHGSHADLQWPNGCSGTMLNVQRKFESAQEFAAWGFDLAGTYDPTDPFTIQDGPIGQGIGISSSNKVSSGNHELPIRYLLMDISVRGTNQCISVSNHTAHAYFYNVRVSHWGDYGFFQGRSWDCLAHAGLHAKQPIGTVTGDGTKQDASDHPGYHVANHGPLRFTAPPFRWVGRNMDTRSLNSWGGAFPSIQPETRSGGRAVMHSYFAEDGERLLFAISCVRSEVGGQLIGYGMGIGTNGDASRAELCCIMAEKIYHISWGSGQAQGNMAPGTTIRNTITILADIPTVNGNWTGTNAYCRAGLETGDGSYLPEAYANFPLEHYNNTIIDRRSNNPPLETGNTEPWEFTGQLTYFVVGDPSIYATIRLHNNVMYGENWDDIGDAADDFDMSSIWTPEMDGYYHIDTFPAVTFPEVAFAPEDAPAAIPGVGSSARGGADIVTEKCAPDDIWGMWRDFENASRGAVEPNTIP